MSICPRSGFMMGNMLNFITASALLLVALYPFSSTAAGKKETCPGRRPLSAAERTTFEYALRVIRSAMPPAPEGWTSQAPEPGDSVPASICEAPGFPLESVYQASFTNEKGILESIQKFERSKSPGRMDRLADEISAAAEKGDSKKLQKLQAEMDSLNSTPAGKMTAVIIVRINNAATAGNIRGGIEIPLPGAKYAYLIEDRKAKKAVFYLGRWNRRGEYVIFPELVKDQSNASVQIIEVIIEGDMAEQMAKTMNLKALNSLLQ
jgi:hypothetical protein